MIGRICLSLSYTSVIFSLEVEANLTGVPFCLIKHSGVPLGNRFLKLIFVPTCVFFITMETNLSVSLKILLKTRM
jgi:hypothetical protein